MQRYLSLVDEVARLAKADLEGGRPTTQVLLDEAVGQLRGLRERSELTSEQIDDVDQRLRGPTAPRPYVADWISELNIAAAQTLGLIDRVRNTAATRCGILLAIAKGLQAKEHAVALLRVSRRALNLAYRWRVEEFAPQLVRSLHYQIGGVLTLRAGPTEGDLDRGLHEYLAAYRLNGGATATELVTLQDRMISAARFLLIQASNRELLGLEPGRTLSQLESAVEVFTALGLHGPLRRARIELVRFYLNHHLLGGAEKILALLQDELSAEVADELTLCRADLLAQRERWEDALVTAEPLLAQGRLPPKEEAYALNIRVNCLEQLGRVDETYAALAKLLELYESLLQAEPSHPGLQRAIALARARLGALDLGRNSGDNGIRLLEQAKQLMEHSTASAGLRLEERALSADALYQAGRFGEALDAYKRASVLRRQAEREVEHLALRMALMTNTAVVEGRIVELSLRLGRPAEAFEAAEGSKSRTLMELARRHSPFASPGGTTSSEMSDEERELVRDYTFIDVETARKKEGLSAVPARAPQRPPLEQELIALERQLEETREQLRRTVPRRVPRDVGVEEQRFAVMSAINLLSQEVVGSQGAKKWGVVSYFSNEYGTGCIGVDGEAEFWGTWDAEWPYERLRRDVFEPFDGARQAFSMEDIDEAAWEAAVDRFCRGAYESLWSSTRVRIAERGLRRLLVLPHRSLHLVPFSALLNEGRVPVIDTLDALCVAPGVNFVDSSLDKFRDPETPPWAPEVASGPSAVLASPDTDAPFVAFEVATVISLLKATSNGNAKCEADVKSTSEALYKAGKMLAMRCSSSPATRRPSRASPARRAPGSARS